ncbi:MAG TPA: hypothetical protein DCQ98_21680 [Planctomycetaceae bacterium]|nr:hypothetical protein [Planctomycetaceae bacterium]
MKGSDVRRRGIPHVAFRLATRAALARFTSDGGRVKVGLGQPTERGRQVTVPIRSSLFEAQS